jgi:hypothetical protein
LRRKQKTGKKENKEEEKIKRERKEKSWAGKEEKK